MCFGGYLLSRLSPGIACPIRDGDPLAAMFFPLRDCARHNWLDPEKYLFQRAQLVFLSPEIGIGNCGKTIPLHIPALVHHILNLLEILMEKVSALVSTLQPLIPVEVGGVTYLTGELGRQGIAYVLTGLLFSSCTRMCASRVCLTPRCLPQSLFHMTSSPGQICSWGGRNAVIW